MVHLLVLKTDEGATSQGRQATSRSRKGKHAEKPMEPKEAM